MWPIEIRAPQLPTSIDDVAELKAGETYVLPASILTAFTPGSATAVTLSGARSFDNVAGMLKWLDRYPYGCLERTTSRAAAGLSERSGQSSRGWRPKGGAAALQEAIDRVLDMQRPDGGFGMWSSSQATTTPTSSCKSTPSTSPDAGEGQGYVVPEGLKRALQYAPDRHRQL